MDPAISIVGFSVIFQMISAFLALRPLQFQGRRTAVLIILTAIALMAFRRVISLDRLIMGNMTKIDLLPEIIALFISILFLIGIAHVGDWEWEIASGRVLGRMSSTAYMVTHLTKLRRITPS